MTALAERISKELTELSEKDQEAILNEVRERLHDLRANKVHEAIKSGNVDTHDSLEVINDLREKHGI